LKRDEYAMVPAWREAVPRVGVGLTFTIAPGSSTLIPWASCCAADSNGMRVNAGLLTDFEVHLHGISLAAANPFLGEFPVNAITPSIGCDSD